MATVSASDPGLCGVTFAPQALQKRLVSVISSEQDGHLVMDGHHKPEHKCPICEQSPASSALKHAYFPVFGVATGLPLLRQTS